MGEAMRNAFERLKIIIERISMRFQNELEKFQII